MIKWVELFHSFQGEGKFTGASSVFLRLWGCNLKCAGFGQPDPINKDTWDLTFRDYNPKEHNIKSYDELPIFGKGCDSEYAHNSKYQHLAQQDTPKDLCEKINDLLPGKQWGSTHLVITGGESLMRRNQQAFVELMREMKELPKHITFETNGTQQLSIEFIDTIDWLREQGVEISFSVSAKLRHVTGELHTKTLKPLYVSEYQTVADHMWLKPVVCDTQGCWDELEYVVSCFRKACGKDLPVYVMPVGATLEEQQEDYVPRVVNKALQLGYHISIRAHVYVFANQVGT